MAERRAAALLLVGAVAVGGWMWASHWAPSPQRYPLQGIDLPSDPGPVTWSGVRGAGARFAYLVATNGKRRDPGFEANWAAAGAAGLRRGAVHLYSLCEPGAAQADAFNVFVPRSAEALPVAVDIGFRPDCAARPPRTVLIGNLARFIAMVEAHSGQPVILRPSPAVERTYALSTALDRPVWALGNFFSPRYAARPWRLWRASDMRRVDGIAGPANWDVIAP